MHKEIRRSKNRNTGMLLRLEDTKRNNIFLQSKELGLSTVLCPKCDVSSLNVFFLHGHATSFVTKPQPPFYLGKRRRMWNIEISKNPEGFLSLGLNQNKDH